MRFFRRALVGLFLVSVTIGLLALAGGTVWSALQSRLAEDGRAPPARERVFSAEVLTLTPGTETPVLTAFGEIRSRRALELRAPAEGRVVELSDAFEEGGAVQAGQVLLRIDPADAEAVLATAQTDLRDAENELAEALRAQDLATEDVAAARRQADLRIRAFERQRDLLDRGVGSAAAVEDAELAAATAEQAVLSRRQAEASAVARVAEAETALERMRIALAEARRSLAETELTAAFDGVLAEVDVAAGRLVSRNERLARLIDADALEVSFRISTAQYARLLEEDGSLPQAPVRVVLDVFGLDLSADAVLTRESGSVGEGQSGRLLFARIDDARGLRVGDFVRVEVEEPPLAGVARLPAPALGSDGRVLVLGEDNRLEAAEVALMRRQGDEVLVSVPPELAGREIVATRTPVLGEGIRVNPFRRDGAGQAEAEAPATIALDPERRARLIAFVENNSFIPEDVRTRMIRQLNEPEVPAQMVARIEARMGS
ncbi:HlyD family efflux transporter periplasmic adaptor subunit [Roseibacterium sp. SDUM158016]|uniref:efflux RND transporter periplasmic adaptor subunit n=1 Tax=Roseicyclus sediminis TaxID=2980997 RepID=UPI0021D376A4|nr:HlyD family efflux transporter periplasmic adaptor subunit [Roseibacterium sp. SDUM158016]MCU4651352.1 HlyD family efflux transporter periplasmic adaptor subunit [Roseibacterium sp. SDUM158016]